MDCNLPGSSVLVIFQASILESLPFPSPGDLPDPGIEPMSLALAGGFFTTKPPRKPQSPVCRKYLMNIWEQGVLFWLFQSILITTHTRCRPGVKENASQEVRGGGTPSDLWWQLEILGVVFGGTWKEVSACYRHWCFLSLKQKSNDQALVSRQPCSIESHVLAVLWCLSHIYGELYAATPWEGTQLRPKLRLWWGFLTPSLPWAHLAAWWSL